MRLIRKNAKLASSNSAEDIAASIQQGGYDLAIVDSVQTISLSEISLSGSVSQIANSSNVIIRAAKAGHGGDLVGHVTKEGSIAGQKYWSIWWTLC